MEKGPTLSLRAQEARSILIRSCGRKTVGKKPNMGSMWKNLQKGVDFEDPPAIIDQVYLGCTHRGAKVDHQAVQFQTEFKKVHNDKGS